MAFPPAQRNIFSSINQPTDNQRGRVQRQRNVAKELRSFLESTRKCDLDPVRGRTRLIQIFNNMFEIAISRKSPYAVAAANLILCRAYGKEKPHDDTLDALAKGGLQLVFVERPELEGEVEVTKTLPVPEFIDGEVVDEQK